MESRRNVRLVVEGVHGSMTFTSGVDVLNMSLGGVALSVDRRLNIGREYTMRLELHETVSVQGVVVWSVLSEIKKGSGGEDVPVYSAGMRFLDVLTPRIREIIEFIDSHKVMEEQRLMGLRFRIRAPGKAFLDVPQDYRVRVISLSGMLIETEHCLELEGHYPMEIAVDALEPIRFSGRVASRIERPGAGPKVYDTGIEFVEIREPDKAHLAEFIESLSKA